MKALYDLLLLASLAGVALFLLKLAVVAAIRVCSSRRPRWCGRSTAVTAGVFLSILAIAAVSLQAERLRIERLVEGMRVVDTLEEPGRSDVERILGRPSRILRGMVDPSRQEPFGAVAETWVYDCSVLLSPDPFSNDYYVSFDRAGRFLGFHQDLD